MELNWFQIKRLREQAKDKLADSAAKLLNYFNFRRWPGIKIAWTPRLEALRQHNLKTYWEPYKINDKSRLGVMGELATQECFQSYISQGTITRAYKDPLPKNPYEQEHRDFDYYIDTGLQILRAECKAIEVLEWNSLIALRVNSITGDDAEEFKPWDILILIVHYKGPSKEGLEHNAVYVVGYITKSDWANKVIRTYNPHFKNWQTTYYPLSFLDNPLNRHRID